MIAATAVMPSASGTSEASRNQASAGTSFDSPESQKKMIASLAVCQSLWRAFTWIASRQRAEAVARAALAGLT